MSHEWVYVCNMPRIPPRDPMDRLIDRCEWQGDCLIWLGTSVRGRYGTFQPGTRQSDPKVYTHRWIYEQTIGPIPEGFEIDHVRARGCTSPLCVNPEHLEPVPPIVNENRARLLVCRAGKHDLTDPRNVTFDRQGRRRGCAGCRRESALKFYYAQKEA